METKLRVFNAVVRVFLVHRCIVTHCITNSAKQLAPSVIVS